MLAPASQSPPRPEGDPVDAVIYAVSHDLRGPLLNFQGFLRRLRRGLDLYVGQTAQWSLNPDQARASQQLREEKIDSSLGILEQNAKRMEQLIDALLNLSRAGREPLDFQQVPLNDLLQQLSEEFAPRLAAARASIEIGPLPVLWSDRARLEEIFRQLLDNAVKFLSPQRPGRIRVDGLSEGAQAVCRVEDNGIGIQAQDLERLFLPFGRAREIEAPGCGVGLAIVRKLAGQLGGRAWVTSAHKEGTAVHLSLPSTP